jgi:hypothetical protein
MSQWGVSLYGDPCRGCGFAWSLPTEEGVAIVVGAPATIGELVSHATGNERHPDLGWSVSEYVCHVSDNLRIWAERLMGVARGASAHVGGYDEHALADARHYELVPLPAALWSLARSVADWQASIVESGRLGAVLVHPQRGRQTVADVVMSNAHDAFHHRWDIERSLEG